MQTQHVACSPLSRLGHVHEPYAEAGFTPKVLVHRRAIAADGSSEEEEDGEEEGVIREGVVIFKGRFNQLGEER